MTQIGPGNDERAWNDPPQLSYQPGNSTTPTSRMRKPNKKGFVPFNPVNTSDNQTSQPITTIIPKGAPPPMATSIMNQDKNIEVGADNVNMSSEQLMEEVLGSLNTFLSQLTPEEQESCSNDINKRLTTLKEMWQQGKLNSTIHHKMYSLVQEMKNNDYDKAWAIHCSLIVDYTSVCSQWMLGVKLLISKMKTHQKPSIAEENVIISPLKE